MRIVGVFTPEGERVVAVRDGAALVPVAPVREFWADPRAALARSLDRHRSIPAEGARLAHALPDGARVLCLGLNYAAHAAEGSFAAPEHPVIFGRWTASLVPDGAPRARADR